MCEIASRHEDTYEIIWSKPHNGSDLAKQLQDFAALSVKLPFTSAGKLECLVAKKSEHKPTRTIKEHNHYMFYVTNWFLRIFDISVEGRPLRICKFLLLLVTYLPFLMILLLPFVYKCVHKTGKVKPHSYLQTSYQNCVLLILSGDLG